MKSPLPTLTAVRAKTFASWWLDAPRDGFTDRAQAEVARMQASKEAGRLSSLYIHGLSTGPRPMGEGSTSR